MNSIATAQAIDVATRFEYKTDGIDTGYRAYANVLNLWFNIFPLSLTPLSQKKTQTYADEARYDTSITTSGLSPMHYRRLYDQLLFWLTIKRARFENRVLSYVFNPCSNNHLFLLK